MRMSLSAAEKKQLEAAGTTLVTLLPSSDEESSPFDLVDWSSRSDEFNEVGAQNDDPEVRKAFALLADASKSMKPGEGYFGMVGRCGNLTEDNLCGDYDNRPEVCVQFPEGTLACVVLITNTEDRVERSQVD